MQKVKCINASDSNVLVKDKEYYAFPVSESVAYISRFPSRNSHFGCFQIDRFVNVSEFEQGKFYVVEMKNVYPKYSKKLFAYAMSAEKLAVYKDLLFKCDLGTMDADKFHKRLELENITERGKCSLMPVSITYGMLMEIEDINIQMLKSVSKTDKSVTKTDQSVMDMPTIVTILPPDPEQMFEQLSFF